MTERKKNWPKDNFTDEELIGYCRIHSQTQRALFHEMHVVRMLRMAGREEEARSIEEDGMGFYSIHEDEMEPIAAAADEYIKRKKAMVEVMES
ncbi:MAG: hypothetical protein WC708_00030 [Lentisphaeria bacterium]|jgi:hypothetical protein